MGELLTLEWTPSDALCTDCVGKVNDYDEAFEKMKSVERELQHIYQSVGVKFEYASGEGKRGGEQSLDDYPDTFPSESISQEDYSPPFAQVIVDEVMGEDYDRNSAENFSCDQRFIYLSLPISLYCPF